MPLRICGTKEAAQIEENTLIDLVIQERLSIYFKRNFKHGQEEVKKADEFLLLIKEKAPELEEDFQNYLNWTAEHGGNE